MRDHNLPPAEAFASPNALHGIFLKSLAAAGQENGDNGRNA